MSYKNLKLRAWTGGGNTRVYIDTKYVERRNVMSCCDGDWIEEGEGGECRASFRGPRCGNLAELSAMGRDEVMAMLALDGSPLLFAELLGRIQQCQTASGAFSYTQYERRYSPPVREVA